MHGPQHKACSQPPGARPRGGGAPSSAWSTRAPPDTCSLAGSLLCSRHRGHQEEPCSAALSAFESAASFCSHLCAADALPQPPRAHVTAAAAAPQTPLHRSPDPSSTQGMGSALSPASLRPRGGSAGGSPAARTWGGEQRVPTLQNRVLAARAVPQERSLKDRIGRAQHPLL